MPRSNLMKKLIVLSAIIVMQLSLSAATIDSLRRALPQGDDNQKTETFAKLCKELDAAGMVEPMLECLDEWLAHEIKKRDTEREGKVRWNKIVAMTNYGLDSLLLEEAPKQMTWFMHHNQWTFYYDTWDSKANVYLYQERVQTALREANNILDDANSRKNNFGRAVAYQLMGIIYESIGQYDHAVSVFRQCLGQLKDSYRDSEVLTNAYDYLSQTLDERGSYQEELAVTQEHERCVQERLKKDPTELSLYSAYIVCLANKASALTGLKRYDEAAETLAHAEQMLTEQNTPLARYRIFWAHCRLALKQGRANEAKAYLDSLERLAINAGGNIELLKADILMSQGNSQRAAQAYRRLYEHKDSTFSRDMRMQLDELNMLFKVDELEMQGKLVRSRFMIGIFVLIVIGLLSFTVIRYRAAMKLEREHERLVESNEKLEQSYKELNIAKKKAEESSKMKTDFIQQISHEIRTPLNILSGFTQVITTPGMVLDETTRNDINQRITENTNRITELVNKMLALSEANSRSVIDSHEDVHAVQIAAQAVDESRISTNKHVAFDMQFSPEMEEVVMHTNLEESTRALTMLLDNAQKFQKERHPMAKETQIGHVRLLLNKHQRFVDFIVEDDGIGIPASEAEHIFEEFVQLDNYYSGTGIGLTIARSIARRLGGNIVLDTSYDDGARFVMTLPINSDNDKKQIKL